MPESNLIDVVDEFNNETRYLMPVEYQRPGVHAASLPVFGDSESHRAKGIDLIPRSQWSPVNLIPFVPPVKDQNGIGACNAFGTSTAIEIAAIMSGQKWPPLSPGDLYGRICGGRDQGSLLEDAIKETSTNGIATTSTCPPLKWQGSSSAEAIAERPLRRVLEWAWAPTVEHLFSAAMRGFPANIGMMWGNETPDADGWLPNHVTGRAGGHAVCRAPVVRARNGKFGLSGPNSWNTTWNPRSAEPAGWMCISEDRLRAEQGNFGWFIVMGVTYVPQGDVPPLVD